MLIFQFFDRFNDVIYILYISYVLSERQGKCGLMPIFME